MLRAVEVDYLTGHSHGDLHLDNAVVAGGADGQPMLDDCWLIDLAAFREEAPLTRDVAALVLSVAARRAGAQIDKAEADELIDFVLSPEGHRPQFIQPYIADSIQQIFQVHQTIPRRWEDIWRAQYLLSIQARALRYTSFRQRWAVRAVVVLPAGSAGRG